jgi:hypothetical protein
MQVNPASSEVLVPSPFSALSGRRHRQRRRRLFFVFFGKERGACVSAEATASARPIHPRIKQLLEEFPSLVRLPAVAPQPRHRVVCHIENNGRPVFAKAQRLEPAKRKVAEEEFAALEKAGIVSRSTSP